MLIFSKDSLRTQVEAATGGKVTVIYDDKGYPSYMVRIPKFNIEDVLTGAGTGVHPAFIVGGVEKSEILIGQYLATVKDGRAVSLPGVDPTASLNFDTALGYCSAKGPGWHMMTNAEWAAIALWCAKNGSEPNGNNNYGRDTALHHESGVRQDGVSPGTASGTARTLTGSGPASWRHDGAITGIADLNGNVWEWCGGMRLNDGEIQVIADNDAAADGADNSATSAAWKAIDAAGGALVAPGTAGSLKFSTTSTPFTSLLPTAPDRAKQLLLATDGSGSFATDNVWSNLSGERLPYRGGRWSNGANAGLGALYLNNARSFVFSYIGFRPAFVV